MASLYTKESVIGKLRKWFLNIFSGETKPTEQHLFELALSVLAPDGFQSVKFNFEHFIFALGRLIRQEVFFATLAGRPELGKNPSKLLNSLKSLALASLKAS